MTAKGKSKKEKDKERSGTIYRAPTGKKSGKHKTGRLEPGLGFVLAVGVAEAGFEDLGFFVGAEEL